MSCHPSEIRSREGSPPRHAIRRIELLGTPVDCLDYATALDEACRLAKLGHATALAAVNTHIISAARACDSFAAVMRRFDIVLPDGMPLVWLLNTCGAGLKDRVYGPYFMRYTLERTPAPWRHFFFGGSQETLDRLCKNARLLNPEIDIAGVLSPPFRAWSAEERQRFVDEINAARPDFIWVALGGERQERWIVENLGNVRRGLMCAVGDAFALLAGEREFAPTSLQHAGLTWLYRLIQEPQRLFYRYVKHNTLFLVQCLADWIAPGVKPARDVKPRVSFLGSRGVPARYAGFETVVDQLGRRLVERAYPVTVYNRTAYYRPDERPKQYLGMRVVYLPTIMHKAFETIVHSTLAMLHCILHPGDIVYLCGVGNALLAVPLRLAGRKVIINVDGIDFKRSKWRGFAKMWLQWSERWAVRHTDCVIADNIAPVNHYKTHYGHTPEHIAYGTSELPPGDPQTEHAVLEQWGLQPGRYILFVSRLSPENRVDDLIEAYRKADLDIPLVVVGPHGYETAYHKRLLELGGPNVVFTGGAYHEQYRALSRHCLFFVLPAAIEATRLVLLDQMGYGNAILFRESLATREVIGDAGEPFDGPGETDNLAEKLRELANNPARIAALREKALARARSEFSWEKITDRYEALFTKLYRPSPAALEHLRRLGKDGSDRQQA